MAGVFTVSDAYRLQKVLQAAQHERRVAWVREDGDPLLGTARGFRTPEGLLAMDVDVRDLSLRVTLDAGGIEAEWNVAELMDAGDDFILRK